MGLAEPIGPRSVGGRIDDGGIVRGHVAGDFVPAMIDLVAQAKIDGQVRPQFEVVLNKYLGTLQASTIFRGNTCIPTVDVAQQEVGVLEAGSGNDTGVTVGLGTAYLGIDRPSLRVLPGILGRASIDIAPRGGIIAVHQQLSAEVQDVFAADHGDDIGRIKDVFLVLRVGTGL